MMRTDKDLQRLADRLRSKMAEITEDSGRAVVAYGFNEDSGSITVLHCSCSHISEMLAYIERRKGGRSISGEPVAPVELRKWANDNRSERRFTTFRTRYFDPGSDEHKKLLGQIVAEAGLSIWPERGVALIDICGFTSVSWRQQIAYLHCLQSAMQKSYTLMKSGSLWETGSTPLPYLRYTTTGDGYYVWNEFFGTTGDCATLAFLLLTLGFLQTEQRLPREGIPSVRSAFTVGRVVVYSDWGIPRRYDAAAAATAEVSGGPRGSYIVGPATNDLARILEGRLAGQIVLGDFRRKRSKKDPSDVGPVDLLKKTISLLRRIAPDDLRKGVSGEFSPLTATGEPVALRVVDKHKAAHYCLNVVCRVPCERVTPPDHPTNLLEPIGVEYDPCPGIANTSFRPYAPAEEER